MNCLLIEFNHKFATDAENKDTGVSKLNDSPEVHNRFKDSAHGMMILILIFIMFIYVMVNVYKKTVQHF